MGRFCNECRSAVPESSPEGLCPKCMLALAANEGTGDAITVELRDAALPLPRDFGNYRLLDLLGKGGAGLVFRAVDRRLNRTVALKMLRSDIPSPTEMRRFFVEAKTAARLQHPNIVTVHEVGEHQGRQYLAMECIEGRSLSHIVGRTPLAPRRAAEYVRAIARAMDYAHSQGVLHRDLKPGNVLVDHGDALHITDFGLAKEVTDGLELTRSGELLGTPSYMSPEQAAAKPKLVGIATDVYSMGAILYDLLTARPPFRADTVAATIRQIIEAEPAPVRLLNPSVPRDLETICLKCLAKDPGQRYRASKELEEDLTWFLEGRPIRARPIGFIRRAGRWAKRHPGVAMMVVAFVIIFALVGGMAVFSAEDARAGTRAAPWISKGFAYDFSRFGEEVATLSTDPTLISMVRTNRNGKSQTSNDLTGYLSGSHGTNAPLVEGERFENWLVMDARGEVLANYTGVTGATMLTNRIGREYFQGATNCQSRYYLSRVYQSEFDARFKFAISAPIRDRQGQLLGVIAKMIGPSTNAQPGFQTERNLTVLIAELEANATNSTEYGIFWHPALQNKPDRIIPIPSGHRLTAILRGLTNDDGSVVIKSYLDPAGAVSKEFEGEWVAGIARIPGSRLFEVYQIRDRLPEAKSIAIWILVITGLVTTVWGVRQRLISLRERGGAPPALVADEQRA